VYLKKLVKEKGLARCGKGGGLFWDVCRCLCLRVSYSPMYIEIKKPVSILGVYPLFNKWNSSNHQTKTFNGSNNNR